MQKFLIFKNSRFAIANVTNGTFWSSGCYV